MLKQAKYYLPEASLKALYSSIVEPYVRHYYSAWDIVYKSLHGLAPQYLFHLFTRNSAGEARTLRNMSTDLKIPKNLP